MTRSLDYNFLVGSDWVLFKHSAWHTMCIKYILAELS